MKKFISAVLALIMVLSLAGCGLFKNDNIVKLNDGFTHEDPKGLNYDQRIVLKGKDFDQTIEDAVNMAAYPDTMLYDESGYPIGMYDYDESTGLAVGWMNMEDGSYTAFPEGEEVDLGKPDPSQMIDIPGTVDLAIVVYGNEEKAVSAYVYFFLSDASAKETVKENAEAIFGFAVTDESDTVLKAVRDDKAIAEEFAMAEEIGETFDRKDAAAYAEILKMQYGVREDSGANPYKPYGEHKDPEGLKFDKKVTLTGSGSEAVGDEYVKLISSTTDYVYAEGDTVVAHFTYYETQSKEDADALMEVADQYIHNPVRISDTVVQGSLVGDEMDEVLTQYMGYSVLADKSCDEYVRMLEATYFSVVYE